MVSSEKFAFLFMIRSSLGFPLYGKTALSSILHYKKTYIKWQITPNEKTSILCDTITFPFEALNISGAMYPGVPHF